MKSESTRRDKFGFLGGLTLLCLGGSRVFPYYMVISFRKMLGPTVKPKGQEGSRVPAKQSTSYRETLWQGSLRRLLCMAAECILMY